MATRWVFSSGSLLTPAGDAALWVVDWQNLVHPPLSPPSSISTLCWETGHADCCRLFCHLVSAPCRHQIQSLSPLCAEWPQKIPPPNRSEKSSNHRKYHLHFVFPDICITRLSPPLYLHPNLIFSFTVMHRLTMCLRTLSLDDCHCMNVIAHTYTT